MRRAERHPQVRCDRSRPREPKLFKADRPRPIDAYIDYFGGAARAPGAERDPCGERLLEALAARAAG